MPDTQPANDTTGFGAGSERRDSLRTEISYPLRLRFSSPAGETLDRFAGTCNVSAGGILFTSVEPLEEGTEVEVHVGLPSVHASGLPAAQLDGTAVVLRSDSIDPDERGAFEARVALRFTQTPRLSSKVSMFD
jgi:hypothetical protein